MRDPNSPIPGFEDEFTGTVGREKRIHHTHFSVPEMPWKKNNARHKQKTVREDVRPVSSRKDNQEAT